MHTFSGLSGLALGVACVFAGCGNGAADCLNQSGFICTIAGTGKAGLGAEREPASQTELFLPQDVALRPDSGGVIVLDNMLAGGRVLEPGNERGELMNALSERIAADERVESVLLGLHDGVTLARRR